MNELRRLSLPLFVAMVLCGCEELRPSPATGPEVAPQSPASPPAATSRPAAAPATGPVSITPRTGEGAVMALVNGQPVYMSELYEILLRGQGLTIAQQLIVSEMVRQEAQRQNITVTEAEFQSENERMMKDAFGTVEESEQRERLLMQLFAQKGLTRQSWDLAVKRNVMLRKLAEPRVKVTDEDLRQEFSMQFGRKVVVRHIEVESLREAEDLLQRLRNKEDFAALAAKHSKNPSAAQGGALPPIGANSLEMPAAIRQVALAMKEVGEISDPVKVGYAFHILKLEKIIEPQEVKFEAVRDKLREVATKRALLMTQQQIVMELMQKGRYEYVDPTLRAINTEATRKN